MPCPRLDRANRLGGLPHVQMNSAEFSPCRKYRYELRRTWGDLLDQGKPGFVAFCMLNPSTADENANDPTIRRCIAFADAWGWKSLVVVNLFAWRSPSPEAMMKEADPIGPQNDSFLESCASMTELFVCAWGNDGRHMERASKTVRHLREGGCLLHRLGELTEKHQPRHPLYLKGDLKPVPL